MATRTRLPVRLVWVFSERQPDLLHEGVGKLEAAVALAHDVVGADEFLAGGPDVVGREVAIRAATSR